MIQNPYNDKEFEDDKLTILNVKAHRVRNIMCQLIDRHFVTKTNFFLGAELAWVGP